MLKDILSIAGKPGLFKMISSTQNAIIVESLLDGKRFPAYSNAKIIALDDISVFTENEEIPLKEVFKRIFEKENGEKAVDHKSSGAILSSYFETVLPEYDRDRVYTSDMKKMIQWYNLLQEKGMLSLDEEEEEEDNG